MGSRPIALLTDFGSAGWYPGVMKGVILGIDPGARIVDLCHDVCPQDISEGAFILKCCLDYFPEGTVFACVVDPGVGGERRNIIVDDGRHLFTGPDNGILSPVLGRGAAAGIFEVKEYGYGVKPKGDTFLGRDLFAPVAARLALGERPDELGVPTGGAEVLHIPDPVVTSEGRLRGRTVHIDRYGNMMTDISEGLLLSVFSGVSMDDLVVRAGGNTIRGVGRYYTQGSPGGLMALINSWGYLEIAVSMGSAAVLPGMAEGGRPDVIVGPGPAGGEVA